jgi:hypothetical protein
MQISISSISCPSCQGPLSPKRLHCSPCDLSIDGDFQATEFAALNREDLHFLRIFIHCEGSIREIESALGLSYPTIKSRLANVKKRLQLDGAPTIAASSGAKAPNSTKSPYRSVDDVLSALEGGEIDHAESLNLIRKLK